MTGTDTAFPDHRVGPATNVGDTLMAMRIAVLCAGNAGQAFAGGMTLSGHEVHLAAVPEHAVQIRVIQAFGGVLVEGSTAAGKPGGFAAIEQVDTDVAAAITWAEVVFLVSPAFGQDTYFEYIAANAPDGQLIVIQPGKFGALRLADVLRDHGRDPLDLLITETETFLYAAKIHGLDRIWLRGIKQHLPIAAYPAERTAEAIERLTPVHRQYVPAANVLQTSLSDPACALHPVTTLLDLSRIEAIGPYRTKAYSISRGSGRMVEAVDAERVRVAAAYGLRSPSLLEQLKDMYGLTGDTAYEAMMQTTVHVDQMTPRGPDHRYVTEEVPFGLVPMSELARLAGLATPNADAIIELASTINQVDYRATGRGLSEHGPGRGDGRRRQAPGRIVTGWPPTKTALTSSRFAGLHTTRSASSPAAIRPRSEKPNTCAGVDVHIMMPRARSTRPRPIQRCTRASIGSQLPPA